MTSFGEAPPRPALMTVLVVALSLLVMVEAGAIGFLVVRTARQGNALRTQGQAAIQQNVKARYDDCQNGEQVRAALRQQVEAGKRTDKLLYRLIPSLDTPVVHKLVAKNRTRQLEAYQPRDCKAFALAAVPPDVRGSYHVP